MGSYRVKKVLLKESKKMAMQLCQDSLQLAVLLVSVHLFA